MWSKNSCGLALVVFQKVLSQSSIFGQNPKIGCQEFNDLQSPKRSKKQLCDRTNTSCSWKRYCHWKRGSATPSASRVNAPVLPRIAVASGDTSVSWKPSTIQ